MDPPTIYPLYYKEAPSFATFLLTEYIDIPLLGHLKGRYTQSGLRKKLNQAYNVVFPFIQEICNASNDKDLAIRTIFSILVYITLGMDIPFHKELLSQANENTNLHDISTEKPISNESYEYWREWCLAQFGTQKEILTLFSKTIPKQAVSSDLTTEERSNYENMKNGQSNSLIKQLVADLTDFIGGVIGDRSSETETIPWSTPIEDTEKKFKWYLLKYGPEKLHERALADVLLNTLYHVDHYKTIPKRNLTVEVVSLESQYEEYEITLQTRTTVNIKNHSYTFINTWDTLDFATRIFSHLSKKKHAHRPTILAKTATEIASKSMETLIFLQYLNTKSLGLLFKFVESIDKLPRTNIDIKMETFNTALRGLLCIDKTHHHAKHSLERYRLQRQIACVLITWTISRVFFDEFILGRKYPTTSKELYGNGIWCLPFDGSSMMMEVFLESNSKILQLSPVQLSSLILKEYKFQVQAIQPRILHKKLQNSNESDQNFKEEITTLYTLLWKLGQIIGSARNMITTTIGEILNVDSSQIPISFVDIMTTIYSGDRSISFWTITQRIRRLMKTIASINRRTIQTELPTLRPHKRNIVSISIFDRMYNILTSSRYYITDETSQVYSDMIKKMKTEANKWKDETNSQLPTEWGMLYGAVAFLPLIFEEIIQSVNSYGADISNHIKRNLSMNTTALAKKLMGDVESLVADAKQLSDVLGKVHTVIIGQRAEKYQQTFSIRFRNLLPYMPQLTTNNI